MCDTSLHSPVEWRVTQQQKLLFSSFKVMGSELKVQLLASWRFVHNIGNLFDPLGNMVWLQLKVYSPPAAGSDWGNVFRLHSGVTDKTFFILTQTKILHWGNGSTKKQALIWLDERLIESFTHFQLQSDFGQVCVKTCLSCPWTGHSSV